MSAKKSETSKSFGYSSPLQNANSSLKVSQNSPNVCIKSAINVDKNIPKGETAPCPYLTSVTEADNKITKSVRIHMEIKMARDLPTNASFNVKHICNLSSTNKEKFIKLSPSEEPNSYVTFQANVGSGIMVKSHEGMVYTTSIIEKSSSPSWNQSFQFSLSPDYLMNKNKRFIVKVWRKSLTLSGSRIVPAPMEDKIIGLVTIDLTALQKNKYISEWFNIVNCFGHKSGELLISAQCLDELHPGEKISSDHNQVDNLLDTFEAGLSINNFNLSRAIKRKFSELEEISQRLRARLLDVTNNTVYINDIESPDEYTKEFELDLNTVAYEDEYKFDFSTIRNLHNPNP